MASLKIQDHLPLEGQQPAQFQPLEGQPSVSSTKTQQPLINGAPSGTQYNESATTALSRLSLPQTSTYTSANKPVARMSDAELATLSTEKKKDFLRWLGVPEKHLRKLKGAKLHKAMLDAVRALQSPGKHKITLKLDKKYELKTEIGRDGQILSLECKRKKGFWGKLGGAFKKISSFAIPVLGWALAPFTGGLSLVASSVYQGAMAVKNKNWLGAAAAFAGAFVPGAGAIAGKTVAKFATQFQTWTNVGQSAFYGIKYKNPSGILGAAAGALGNTSGYMANKGGQIADWGRNLQRTAQVTRYSGAIISSIKNKDYLSAAGYTMDVST